MTVTMKERKVFRNPCAHRYGFSVEGKNRQISELVRIGEILPDVMAKIEKRIQRHHRVEVGIDIADYTIKE